MWMSILTEAIAHQLLPLFAEVTLPALHAFGQPVWPWPVAVALAGGLCAVALLIRLGRTIGQRLMAKDAALHMAHCKRLMPFLCALMLFVTTPLGFAICIAAGIFAVPLRFAMPLALVGLLFVYGGDYGI